MQNLHLNIGKCIYCDNTMPPLTREHILPRGLGGNEAPTGLSNALVLNNASVNLASRLLSELKMLVLLR